VAGGGNLLCPGPAAKVPLIGAFGLAGAFMTSGLLLAAVGAGLWWRDRRG